MKGSLQVMQETRWQRLQATKTTPWDVSWISVYGHCEAATSVQATSQKQVLRMPSASCDDALRLESSPGAKLSSHLRALLEHFAFLERGLAPRVAQHRCLRPRAHAVSLQHSDMGLGVRWLTFRRQDAVPQSTSRAAGCEGSFAPSMS